MLDAKSKDNLTTRLRATGAVVIPCFNAGVKVAGVIQETLKNANHVFVVDDGSTDGAVEALAGLPITIIRFEKNRGKGTALLAGFRAALDRPEVSCVISVDADGQHDPGEIPRLYEVFVEHGADVVIGARTFDRQRVPWGSWLGNTMTSKATAWFFGRRLPDTQSGFRLYARGFIEDIVRTIPGGRYETEMGILLKAIREERILVSVPIKTIYEAGNPTSHFRKVRDSLRVYSTFAGAWLRSRGSP